MTDGHKIRFFTRPSNKGFGKNMWSDWKEKEFIECLIPVSFERSKQIQANSYLRTGEYPIVDQGKDLIVGWTNDESVLIKGELPLIIFGDHTRIFKYVDFPFALGADGTKLIKPKQDEFSAKFFYYYLLTINVPERGYNRHYKLLKEQIIRYPPLAEQQKIAAVLYEIQKAIEIQESIIEKTLELKKSTLHHVFTHGLHGEKLKETEIGQIPESWVLNRINNLLSETTHTDPLKAPQRKIKYIDVSSISNTRYIIETWAYLLGKDAPSRARKVVEEGDVVVATVRPTLRRIARITPDFNNEICSTAFCVLRPKRGVLDEKYLFYAIQRDEFFAGLEKLQQGASYPAVADSDVKDQWIPLPSIAEQNEIAYYFQVIDQKIELYTAKKSTLQDLFKTMLNKLMTDEIRVKDLEMELLNFTA
jgi:type I restriction enzyme S subunit